MPAQHDEADGEYQQKQRERPGDPGAQQEARRLVHDLAGDRIGLIAFSGQSYILSPLTIDGSALQLLIDALDPNMASAGGTELGGALRQGADLLRGGSDVADRVLVVFTDGETHDTLSRVLSAAARLRREGVRLIMVGEGGITPAHIPVRTPEGAFVEYQRTEPGGPLVETWRRDAVLTQVADAAHGALVPAQLGDQAGAVRELVQARPGEVESQGATLMGFSQGAYAAFSIARSDPGQWSRLLLIAAKGYPNARRLRRHGVERVLFAAGDYDMTHAAMSSAARSLARNGFPARFMSLGKVGHTFPSDMTKRMTEAMAFLKL